MPLKLTRKMGESFELRDKDGNKLAKITCHYRTNGGGGVALLIDAPDDVQIVRDDVRKSVAPSGGRK